MRLADVRSTKQVAPSPLSSALPPSAHCSSALPPSAHCFSALPPSAHCFSALPPSAHCFSARRFKAHCSLQLRHFAISALRLASPGLTSLLVAGGALLLGSCAPTVRAAGHTADPSAQAGSNVQPSTTIASPHSPAPDQSPLAPPQEGTEPERQALYAQVPAGGRLIGGAGGIALEGFGRSGHWVAYCQVSAAAGAPSENATVRGAALKEPQLFLHLAHKSQPIDALLATEASGRYLVVLSDGKAWLIDATTEERLDLSPLGPDLRADGLAEHRSFAFSPAGLALLRAKKDDEEYSGAFLPLFAPTLPEESALAKESIAIQWGPRPVWRIGASAQSLHATTLPEGASEERWPVPARASSPLTCRAPSGPYPAYSRINSFRPDPDLEHSWVALPRNIGSRKLTAAAAPGFVMPFQDGWVRREDSGRLVFVRHGIQKQIASANCGARILRADEESGLFVVACEEYAPVVSKASQKRRGPPKYRFDLFLIRPGFVRGLKVDLMRTGVDEAGPLEQSLFPLRPGAAAALVDFSQRKLIHLDGDVQVLTTNEKFALLRKEEGLVLWGRRAEESIDHEVPPLAPIVTAGPAVAVGTKMLLLGDDLSTWDLPAAPLAITELGYALIPKTAPSLSAWPDGPLLLVGPQKALSAPPGSGATEPPTSTPPTSTPPTSTPPTSTPTPATTNK